MIPVAKAGSHRPIGGGPTAAAQDAVGLVEVAGGVARIGKGLKARIGGEPAIRPFPDLTDAGSDQGMLLGGFFPFGFGGQAPSHKSRVGGCLIPTHAADRLIGRCGLPVGGLSDGCGLAPVPAGIAPPAAIGVPSRSDEFGVVTLTDGMAVDPIVIEFNPVGAAFVVQGDRRVTALPKSPGGSMNCGIGGLGGELGGVVAELGQDDRDGFAVLAFVLEQKEPALLGFGVSEISDREALGGALPNRCEIVEDAGAIGQYLSSGLWATIGNEAAR